jgi:MoaA/NifB/PqqE/SkfB family radical SAM enzyme
MIKFKQLTLDFTRLCNSHCRLCKIWDIKNPVTLETKYIEKLLSQIDELETIYISGGEPYINPQIIDIAKLVLKYHPQCLWLGATNSIDPNTVEKIKEIKIP